MAIEKKMTAAGLLGLMALACVGSTAHAQMMRGGRMGGTMMGVMMGGMRAMAQFSPMTSPMMGTMAGMGGFNPGMALFRPGMVPKHGMAGEEETPWS